MIDLTVDLSGFESWEREMEEKSEHLPLDEIGENAVEFIRETFESGGRGSWQPPKTVSDHPLLINTGDLVGSITTSQGKDEVLVTSPLDYATYQNDGTNNIAAREFMYIDDMMESKIEDILSQHFTD